MLVPYIKIYQQNEMFFLTKFKLSDLKQLVSFHFRHDDQQHFNTSDIERYIETLQKKGLELKSSEEGVQRRLEIKRINEIKNYLEDNQNIIFPTTIILSCDIDFESQFYSNYLTEDSKEVGYFEFDPNIHSFRIIDGQHRLAGMFIADEYKIPNLEISTTILFNIGIPTEARLFSDINGKQKSVSKSLIYDLYGEIGEDEINKIYKYHNICKNLNTEPTSPLFMQIKMLGTGKGAVSQAFFIDYLKEIVHKYSLEDMKAEYLFEQLFFYFKAFQITFPDDWPVLNNANNSEEHSHYVLRVRKSQLVKTNGFGAILLLFPIVHNYSNKTFESYLSLISKLKDEMNWLEAEGTGRKYQAKYLEKMKNILRI